MVYTNNVHCDSHGLILCLIYCFYVYRKPDADEQGVAQMYMELDTTSRANEHTYIEPLTSHVKSTDLREAKATQDYMELDSKTREKESVYQEPIDKGSIAKSKSNDAQTYLELDENTREKVSTYEEPLKAEAIKDEQAISKSDKYEEIIQIGKPLCE